MGRSFSTNMAPPLIAGRYQLRQQLSKRQEQRTCLAYDKETQEFVVLRFLLFKSEIPEDTLSRLERESERLKTLQHPCIPPYLNYFTIDLPPTQAFVLVQEQAEGKSLREHLNSDRVFTETEARQLARVLLDILAYLHGLRRPMIHCNIKPSNILVGDWAEKTASASGAFTTLEPLYLIDFGSVQAPVTADDSSSTISTANDYTPPEQFAGRPVMASDLYALGLTLIDLVTEMRISQLPRKNHKVLFEDVVNLSPGFTEWLRRMAEPALPFRFPSVKIALDALEKIS